MTESNLRTIDETELPLLATGAWILGAGGGGNPYHSLLNVQRLYTDGHKIRLIQPEALEDDALVAVVSTMGAPLVGEERLTDSAIAAAAVVAMEDYLGKKFDAVMSLEIGGANSMQPFMVAAHLNIPVVDADTMGRAYPEAQMSSFAIADLKPYPLSLADIRDNAIIISRVESWRWMERISRKVCTEVGSIAATCKAPRTGKEVKDWGILHTVTKAIDIGRAVHEARRKHTDPIQAIIDIEGGRRLFAGKITDVERRTTEGFLRGFAAMAGLDDYKDAAFRVEFQNEFAVGFLDAQPLVMVPEIICIVDTVSGEAVGTETLRYGQRVTVIALPAPAIQLTEAGLNAVGPRAFGYDLDFVSVFDGAGT